MSAKLIVYLLLIFLLQNSGECSQASLSLNHEEISECVNCQCLTDIGNYVFAGSESVEEKPDIFQSKNCQSPDLPSPGNLMVASVIGGALTNAGSGGSLESCHDQWDILVERLSRRKYHKDCSTGGSSDELLARCGEDAYILSEYMDYRSHQSAAGNQLLSEAESDCKGVAVVFSAINILIRFENTAFLNNLVRSRALEDLIIKDDEDIEKRYTCLLSIRKISRRFSPPYSIFDCLF